MSALEAAIIIRSFREKYPELNTDQLVETARLIRTDFFSYDYEAGSLLEGQVPSAIPSSPPASFFRSAIDSIVASSNLVWTRFAPAGRYHVLQAIGINGAQCLREAGLMDDSKLATDWWDALATSRRAERDASLLAQGREGERLSLLHERERLLKENILREPEWVSIEDNKVGYDILSYVRKDGHVRNRLIEVKTSRLNPPRMFLSRNEWVTASQYGDAFEFHLWQLPTNQLMKMSVDQVRNDIPTDQGLGKWQSVEVYVTKDHLP